MLPVSSNIAHSAVISNSLFHPPRWVHRLVYAGNHRVENVIDCSAMQIGVIAISLDVVKQFDAKPIQSAT